MARCGTLVETGQLFLILNLDGHWVAAEIHLLHKTLMLMDNVRHEWSKDVKKLRLRQTVPIRRIFSCLLDYAGYYEKLHFFSYTPTMLSLKSLPPRLSYR